MTRKTLGVILAFSLCLGLAACGSKNENPGSVTDGDSTIFEPIDDSTSDNAKTPQEESAQLPEGVEFNTADGFYSGTLQSSGQDKIGAANEYGLLYTIIYKAEIIDNNLLIYGNFGYRNSMDQDIISVSDDGIYAFTITEDTIFQMAGGEDGPEIVSIDEFKTYLSQLIDSQLYFEVQMAGNSAVTVTISA